MKFKPPTSVDLHRLVEMRKRFLLEKGHIAKGTQSLSQAHDEHGRRLLYTTETRSLLTVLINGQVSSNPATAPFSASEQEAHIFGEGGFVKEMEMVSHGQLSFSNAGVHSVTISEDMGGDDCLYQTYSALADAELLSQGIDVSTFQHRVYMLPNGACPTKQWTATATLCQLNACDSQKIWFRAEFADRKDAFMHEIGHNLGLHHAGQKFGIPIEEYGDHSCRMSTSSQDQKGYNAAHTWAMGFMGDKVGSWNTTASDIGSTRTVHLTAMHLFDPDATGSSDTHIYRINDLYISFANKAGYNSGLESDWADKINVIRWDGDFSITMNEARLSGFETYTEHLVETAIGIRVSALDTSTGKATIIVTVSGASPTAQPTPAPTHKLDDHTINVQSSKYSMVRGNFTSTTTSQSFTYPITPVYTMDNGGDYMMYFYVSAGTEGIIPTAGMWLLYTDSTSNLYNLKSDELTCDAEGMTGDSYWTGTNVRCGVVGAKVFDPSQVNWADMTLHSYAPLTPAPTGVPTTANPTASPTTLPTNSPTTTPTTLPTGAPTLAPTTGTPTAVPTTGAPTTARPTSNPTNSPTAYPTHAHTWETALGNDGDTVYMRGIDGKCYSNSLTTRNEWAFADEPTGLTWGTAYVYTSDGSFKFETNGLSFHNNNGLDHHDWPHACACSA